MAVDDPWAIDGLPLSALEWRRATSGLLLHAGNTISAVAGILSGCTVTVSGLTATISAGQFVVTPVAGVNGSYLVGCTPTTVTLDVRDATYGRIDRVVARIYDDVIDASGQSRAAIEVLTGVPSAVPAAPSLPSGMIEIAQLQVPSAAGGSVIVMDQRSRTTAAGGTPWFADTTLRNAALPAPLVGQLCVTGSGAGQTLWMWTSTAWVAVWSPPSEIPLTSLFAAGTPQQAPKATRDGAWVSLDGGWGMAAGTAPVTPAIAYNASVVLLQLPVGWRPAKQQDFPSQAHSSAALMGASIRVQTNGDVEVRVNNGGGSASTTATFSLGAVRFRAAS